MGVWCSLSSSADSSASFEILIALTNVEHTLNGVLECGVQVVDNLGENIGWALVAVLIDHENLQAPFPHGELVNWRLVANNMLVSKDLPYPPRQQTVLSSWMVRDPHDPHDPKGAAS